MFNTYGEAAGLNSKCSFCGMDKFEIVGTFSGDEKGYELLRCKVDDCTDHCKWNHEPVVTKLRLADRDSVSIVSGW